MDILARWVLSTLHAVVRLPHCSQWSQVDSWSKASRLAARAIKVAARCISCMGAGGQPGGIHALSAEQNRSQISLKRCKRLLSAKWRTNRGSRASTWNTSRWRPRRVPARPCRAAAKGGTRIYAVRTTCDGEERELPAAAAGGTQRHGGGLGASSCSSRGPAFLAISQ